MTRPTIDVDSDVHEVRAHPNRPGVVMAAAAIGLCTSRDGGVTWEVEQEGLHASHCSAVAFAGDDVLVSASLDPFAEQGAIYRRRVDGHDSLVAVGGGLPEWTDGIIDTGCIATHGSAVALADRKGNLLRVSRHRPQLVAPGRRPPTPEQRPHRLSANGRYCLRARVTQILELFGKDSWRRTAGPSPKGSTLAAEATAKDAALVHMPFTLASLSRPGAYARYYGIPGCHRRPAVGTFGHN